MPDNYEPDPNVSPCVNCIWKGERGDNNHCKTCVHRNKVFRPIIRSSHK